MTKAMIKLYTHDMSPPGRAVVATLREVGLDFETVVVNFITGEHDTKEFKKINPRGKVPALVHGDLHIGER